MAALLASICLLGIIPEARAEKWVRVFIDEEAEMFADVDVDSIHEGDDGLIYYRVSTDIGSWDAAVDCQKRISYQLTNKLGKVSDWKSKGEKYPPGSNGAKIADFVCARAEH